ncbi:Tripartite-type tricarboxylate transporter, receptor component TctC [Roseomonas rosea]|uniref:Tripartite-type tricarboxylate transporter, receptor component TctC n=1 Tax=Muricoccus roseus TaxID=198092 RepID=A0A1M6I0X3_9PROT|nr:Tripartite-type tricarboxylate transporter, receptor component TctC [Roseomonas rosea]
MVGELEERRERGSLPRRLVLASPALLLPRAAHAQWPDRPIRLVAPFPPGSGTDLLARIISEPLSRLLGQPVVVENRAGGNGVVGAQAVAMAPADGTTLLMFGVSVAAISPHTVPRLPYNTLRDFAPIGMIAEQPYILVVPPDAPGGDLAGWLEAVKGRDLTYAYGNAGSQIMGAMLAKMAGLNLTGVPYRGGVEALTDVSVGRVDCNFADFGAGIAQHRGGRVRALAESMAKTFPLSPELPPLATRVPGFDADVWLAVAAPAATPASVISKLSGALDDMVRDPTFGPKLASLGLAPLRKGAAEFGGFLESQVALWGERVRMAGIQAG